MLHLHQRIITQITITTTVIMITISLLLTIKFYVILILHNFASPPGSYVPTPTSLRFHPCSSRHPTAFSMLHIPSGAATHRQHGTGHAVPVAQAVKGRRRWRRLRWGESVKPTARVLCIYRNYVMYDIIYIYIYVYIFIYWQSLEDNCLAKRFSKCTADNQYYLCFTRSHPFISFYHQPKWLTHMSLIMAPVGPGQVLWKWRAATSWQNRFTVPPDLAARGPALAAWRHEPWSEPKKTEDNQVEPKQWKWVVEIGKAMAMSFHQVHICVGVFIYIRPYIYILIQFIPFTKTQDL